MAKRVGVIIAELQAKSAEFQKGLQQAETQMAKTRRTIQENTDTIGKAFGGLKNVMGTLGIGLSAGAVIGVLRSIGQEFEKIKDGASQANVSIEDFQVLEYIARNNGASVETFTTALNKLDAKLADAVAGNEKALEFFDRLGVSVGKFSQMDGGERLVVLAQYIQNSTDKAQAFSQVAEILGEKNLPKLREALHALANGWKANADAAAANGIIQAELIRRYDDITDSVSNLARKTVVALGDMTMAAYDYQNARTKGDAYLDTLDETRLRNMQKMSEDQKKLAKASMITGAGFFNPITNDDTEERGKKVEALIAKRRADAEATKQQTEATKALAAAEIDAKIKREAAADAFNKASLESLDAINGMKEPLERLNALMAARPMEASKETQEAWAKAVSATNKEVTTLYDNLKRGAMSELEKGKEVLVQLDAGLMYGRLTKEEYQKLYAFYDPARKKELADLEKRNEYMKALLTPAEEYRMELEKIAALKLSPADTEKAKSAAKTKFESSDPGHIARRKLEGTVETRDDKVKAFDKELGLAKGAGMSDAKADLARKKFLQDLDQGKLKTKAMSDAQTLLNNLQDKGFTSAAQKVERMNDAFNNGQLSVQEYANGIDVMKEKFTLFAQIQEKVTTELSAGLADAIVEGKSLGDVFKSLAKDIAKMILQQMMLKALKSVFGGFASGGVTPKDEPFIVGENGPEIMFPGQSSYVLPNADTMKVLGGAGARSGGDNVTLNFAPVINGGNRAEVRREMQIMGANLRKQIHADIINRKQRGMG